MNSSLMIMGALAALIAVGWNGRALRRIEDRAVKWELGLLLSFAAMRYITLIAYSRLPSYEVLNGLRYFYFASSIGLGMTLAISIWQVTPFLREKMKASLVPILFLPWNLFDLYMIIDQPTQMIRKGQSGYLLALSEKFQPYMVMAQGSFTVILIVLCLAGMIKHKHLQIRTQLFFILAALMLLGMDGLSYVFSGTRVFLPFTVTEAFGFAASCFALSRPLRHLAG